MNLKFDEMGLIPAVVQDYVSGRVLMLAYMNEESIKITKETGKATFFSRSKQRIWTKGETSGNFMLVKEILVDCDCDSLLIKSEPLGPACHTENTTCFYRKQTDDGLEIQKDEIYSLSVLNDVYNVICDRRANPNEGSYTNYLFDKGIDKQLKKVGEEAAEVIIAAKNPDISELRYEAADLLFHLMVLMNERGLSWKDINEELAKRRK